MYLSTMSEWLAWIERIHPTQIELGLERVKLVAQQLNILSPTCPIIIVGGTNGKGSTVYTLESIYQAAGFRTGAFISPILFQHNEQVRINGEMASDQTFCDAFAQVESARGEITLTPFEFCTLAALCIFKSYPIDVLILEVGLGGRLDAVNILNADVSIITSISLDHMDWLGDTREKIGYEKAGIFRNHSPAICGDDKPPSSIITTAAKIGAPLFLQDRDFNYQEVANSAWDWQYQETHLTDLPKNGLALQNMSGVLMAITLLQDRLPVNRDAIIQGLKSVHVPGRIQIIPGEVPEIYDVSHNPAAVALLNEQLKKMPHSGKTYAVFSMLADKDIRGSLVEICVAIDAWYVAPLAVKRAATESELKDAFERAKIPHVHFTSSLKDAYLAAKKVAIKGDRIVIFGSFHTVANILSDR